MLEAGLPGLKPISVVAHNFAKGAAGLCCSWL